MPFHAVSFSATLIGSGEPGKTVDVIKGFHWLTYEGGDSRPAAGAASSPMQLWRNCRPICGAGG